MIGDRDFHHQQQTQICTFHNCSGKANLFASDSTRAIRGHPALRWTQGTIKQTKFGTGIITCRRKPDADWAMEDL